MVVHITKSRLLKLKDEEAILVKFSNFVWGGQGPALSSHSLTPAQPCDPTAAPRKLPQAPLTGSALMTNHDPTQAPFYDPTAAASSLAQAPYNDSAAAVGPGGASQLAGYTK